MILSVGEKFVEVKVTKSRISMFAFKKYGNVELMNARSLLQRI